MPSVSAKRFVVPVPHNGKTEGRCLVNLSNYKPWLALKKSVAVIECCLPFQDKATDYQTSDSFIEIQLSCDKQGVLPEGVS